MINKLSHVTFFVTDQAAAYEFYVGKLGFNVHTDATKENGFRWLTITPPDQPELEIALLAPLAGGMGFDEETKNAFRVLLEKGALGAGVLQTPDCLDLRFRSGTYEELKAKGVAFKSAPKEQFYGVEAIITDGLGNWFSMTQPK